MKTITIPITLPEDVASEAGEKGLLDPAAVVMLLREALAMRQSRSSRQAEYPPDFDPRLKRLVDPELYRKGTILGDIVAPLDAVWEAAE